MTKLSVAISSWLSASFGLSTMRNFPSISSFGTVASYNGHSRTIYVPEGWNGSSPAEMSEFVREMTYYLQSESGVAYECKPEQFAKAVQDRWLACLATVCR
jgi:predicted TIM-barrel fold metal-dependent hydrolase